MVTKHFGSVIGGSFMTGFFTVGDYIFDLIKPKETRGRAAGGCANLFNKSCSCCTKVFDLVRSDAMAYINLTGNPYCNSARYCEYLCDKSMIMEGSQTASRTYRLSAHMMIASIVGICSLYIKG